MPEAEENVAVEEAAERINHDESSVVPASVLVVPAEAGTQPQEKHWIPGQARNDDPGFVVPAEAGTQPQEKHWIPGQARNDVACESSSPE
jgi:hypothetical protein